MSIISITPSHIGEIFDKNNVLTYTITSDEMTTITEKVNGVVVGTKDVPSGQENVVALTQEQWDTVRFGKYADNGINTLTIEMGTEKWTYTFDKRLASNADTASIAKSVKDANEVFLPAVKSKLASALRIKGGSVVDNASWEEVESAIAGIPLGLKYANGTVTSSSTVLPFQNAGSTTTVNMRYVEVTDLPFKPKTIIIFGEQASVRVLVVYKEDVDSYYPKTVKHSLFNNGTYGSQTNYNFKANASNAYVSDTGFLLPFNVTDGVATWEAWGE